MLILSRKIGERIVVAGDIVITVVQTRGNTVKIGVAAPAEIGVHREEVFRRIDAEQMSISSAAARTYHDDKHPGDQFAFLQQH